MLKDFRESFAPDLLDAVFQREFLIAAHEDEGMSGVVAALDEILNAVRKAAPEQAPQTAAHALSVLGELGYDLALVQPGGAVSSPVRFGTARAPVPATA